MSNICKKCGKEALYLLYDFTPPADIRRQLYEQDICPACELACSADLPDEEREVIWQKDKYLPCYAEFVDPLEEDEGLSKQQIKEAEAAMDIARRGFDNMIASSITNGITDDHRMIGWKTMTSNYKPPKKDPIDEILEERHKTHGHFLNVAYTASQIRTALGVDQAYGEQHYSVEMREALVMLSSKLARIANGDPYVIDHWDDIGGYCKLAAKSIRPKLAPEEFEGNLEATSKSPDWDDNFVAHMSWHNPPDAPVSVDRGTFFRAAQGEGFPIRDRSDFEAKNWSLPGRLAEKYRYIPKSSQASSSAPLEEPPVSHQPDLPLGAGTAAHQPLFENSTPFGQHSSAHEEEHRKTAHRDQDPCQGSCISCSGPLTLGL